MKLVENQQGFRPMKSCHSALTVLTNAIYNALAQKNGKCIVVYYDARSAFDSIDRSTLLRKLMTQFRLHPTIIKVIRAYFTDRVIKIKGDSRYFRADAGTGQGSVTSPTYFNAYQNDLDLVMLLRYLLYADDLGDYVSGTNVDLMLSELETQGKQVEDWYTKNHMQINYDKTKFQIFCKSTDPVSSFPNAKLIINNNVIEQVNQFKYLGVQLDSHMTFKSHLKYVSNIVAGRLSYLYRIKRQLTEKAMVILLNCKVQSIVDYCLDIWAVHTDKQLEPLQNRIDTFLKNFLLPKTCKAKSKRQSYSSYETIRQSLDIITIRNNLNLLSITERRDFFLLKHAFDSFIKPLRDVLEDNDKPRLPVLHYKYEIPKKSNNYRSILLWNQLPRNTNCTISTNTFSAKVKELLVKRRKKTL